MSKTDLSELQICQDSFHPLMEGDGPDRPEIMIVGEAPGSEEDRIGRPFVGRSGIFLKKDLLRPSGIDITTVRFTNAVRCHPPNNRTPTIGEIEKFYPLLDAEVRATRPKVVVVTGSAALASVFRFIYKGSEAREAKVSGILKWRGKQIWHREWGCWVVPTPHPRYTMTKFRREGSEYHYLQGIADFELANKLAKQKRPRMQKVESRWITTVSELRSMLDEMEASERFAFDIETGGTGKPDSKWIIGASFATNSRVGYYATWELVESDPRSYERVLELVASSREKIMHNGAYEIAIFRALGLPINTKYFDTMIAANMVDENFYVGLKPLTWVHTTFGGYELPLDQYKYEHKVEEDYSLIPDEVLAPYGGYDAVATYRLWEVFSERLEKMGSMSAFAKIIMPVRRTMSDAEYTGIYLDRERAEELSDACARAKTQLEEQVYEAAGRKFNINSTKQLATVLYDEIGLKPLKETDTGNWSTDAESLEYLASQKGGDVARILVDRSYLKTMHSSHVEQALRFVQDDSRVHTSYNLTGTVTGRASCSRPGIHNVPNDALIRGIYSASPGNLFADSDLKSAELAYLAAESGEEVFLRAFNEGRDLHSDTYRMVFDLPDDYEPTKEQRRFAKTINFGLVYGMSQYGLARRLGITLEEAEDFLEKYFDRLPKVTEYMLRKRQEASDNGYVTSLFGGYRHLPLAQSDLDYEQQRAFRQAMNAPIQQGAAFYTYLGLARLRRNIRKMGLEAKIVHTVHDCALVDFPSHEQESVEEAIRVSFEQRLSILPVQMRVETEITKRWGEHNDSRLRGILESAGIELSWLQQEVAV